MDVFPHKTLSVKLRCRCWNERHAVVYCLSFTTAGKTGLHNISKKKLKFLASHTDPSESPAFLCEKISVDVDLKKVADVAVEDLIQKQNVLYISRGQLKKHISTMVNFNISIRFISQQVRIEC